MDLSQNFLLECPLQTFLIYDIGGATTVPTATVPRRAYDVTKDRLPLVTFLFGLALFGGLALVIYLFSRSTP